VPVPGAPFRLKLTPDAETSWNALATSDQGKWKKVNKALKYLKNDPGHRSLAAHKWDTLRGRAPDGGDIWTAYAENNTPSAWRIFFFYDSRDPGLIYVTTIEPHS
jgi:hypothetical protein